MSRDPLAMLAAMTGNEAARRANAAAANRAAMPECTAAIDLFRSVYGMDGVKVLWMSEGGREVGKRPVSKERELDSADYIALHANLADYARLTGGKRK